MRITHLCCAVLSMLAAAPLAAQTASQSDLSVGQSVEGELVESDRIYEGQGMPSDFYAFEATAGAQVAVSMESEAFDTYLVLLDAEGTELRSDDDSGTGVNARLTLTVPTEGRYTVVATSFGQGAGPYTLSVHEVVRHPLSPESVELGATVMGRLEDGDAMIADEKYVDGYRLEAEAGQQLELTLQSFEFDTYLYLVGPSGEHVATDDDGFGVGTNSRIQTTLQAPGTYTVLVSSYGRFEAGGYELTVTEEFSARPVGQPLTVGTSVSGALTGDDESDSGGGRRDRYTFEIAAGQEVVASVTSAEFDTYLSLTGPEGFVIGEDDDSGGGLNSLLSRVATVSGAYEIAVSSYGGGDGAYELRVDVEEPAPVVAVTLTPGEAVSGRLEAGDARPVLGGGYVDVYWYEGEAGQDIRIELGGGYDLSSRVFAPTGEEIDFEGLGYGGPRRNISLPMTGRYIVTVVTYESGGSDYSLTVGPSVIGPVVAPPLAPNTLIAGRLEESDSLHPLRSTAMDAYDLTVEEGSAFEIVMTSSEVDGYLELSNADGVQLAAIDDSDGFNPIIRQYLAPGTYRVVATQYAEGAGPYTLEARTVETHAVVVETIAVGDHVVATLEETDAVSLARSTAADFYRFEAGAGQALTIEMTSEAIDTYVMVLDELGMTVAEDDDSADNLNSRVTITVPTAGMYTIVATQYGGTLGAYELFVREGHFDVAPEPEL